VWLFNYTITGFSTGVSSTTKALALHYNQSCPALNILDHHYSCAQGRKGLLPQLHLLCSSAVLRTFKLQTYECKFVETKDIPTGRLSYIDICIAVVVGT
jgi:hypothetical protein